MTIMDLVPYLVFWTVWFSLSNAFEFVFFKERLGALPAPYLNTANQLSNLIHAAVVILLGFYIMVFEYGTQGALTFWQRELFAFSSAFFIVDTLVLLLFRHFKMDILFHHVIVLLALASVVMENSGGWILGSFFALGELGPCVYIEKIARRWGVQSENFYGWNDTLYLFSFLLSRLVGLAILYYISIFKVKTHLPLLVIGAVFLALGVYWSVLLVSRYKRRYPASFIGRKLSF